MVVDRPWRSLEVDGAPLLFLKARLDESTCDLQLTDLNKLWGATLRRDELVSNARDQGTSIDPGEDSEQYGQFLAKVESALNGEKKTTLALGRGSQQDWLSLRLSAPLPGSLPTFKWSVELCSNMDSSTAFESQLLTPILIYASSLRSQVQTLVDELAHKDRVISKITDKLETSGNDLTLVFPGVSNVKISRKNSQRAQLASHIKGLGDFDQVSWRKHALNAHEDDDISVEEMNRILSELPKPRISSVRKDAAGVWGKRHGQANEKRDSETGSHDRSQQQARRLKAANEDSSDAAQDSMQDDDFQHQANVPLSHRQHSPQQGIPDPNDERNLNESAPSQWALQDDESTADEDDLDAPSQKPPHATQASQQNSLSSRTLSQGKESPQAQYQQPSKKSPPRRRLGAHAEEERDVLAAGADTDPETEDEAGAKHPAEDSARPAARSRLGAFGGKTKSRTPEPKIEPTEEVNAQTESSPKRKPKLGAFGVKSKKAESPESERTPSPVTKPKSKLGAFGGRKKKEAQSESPTEPQAETSSKPAGKLGRFGGKKVESALNAEAEEPASEEERQPRAQEKQEEPQERETSEERANRNREKLKRELDEKAKAPAKKKRKF